VKIVTLITALALSLATAAAGSSGLAALSDEFDNPASLATWQVIEGDLQDGVAPRYDVGATTAGQLTVVPGRSWWFGDTRAFFLYKQVRGDFKATMLVNVTGKQAPLPTADWSLSGILVRAATGDRARENWVSLRSGVVGGAPVFERKTTRTSRSELVLAQAVPGWVELRIVRLGPRFVLLRRYPAARWQLHWVYSRYDLPALLQVGVDAFSGDEDMKADLVSHVEYFRFAQTGVPRSLKRRYLAGRVRIARLLPYLTQ
jgi:hypothetical protein